MALIAQALKMGRGENVLRFSSCSRAENSSSFTPQVERRNIMRCGMFFESCAREDYLRTLA